MKKAFARVVGLCMALALSVFVLAAAIWGLGTCAPLMRCQFERYAPPMYTGLESEFYPGMAEMITDYLRGTAAEFQFYADGVPLFQAHEQTHMADCLALFQLDWSVLWVSGAAVAALAAAAALGRLGRRIAAAFWAGTMAVLGVVLLVGILGAIDFDRLFILFHQLSFTNDLWLLNPATDLLIRLMPTAFFISYAGMGLGIWLGALLLMAGLSGWITLGRKHGR